MVAAIVGIGAVVAYAAPRVAGPTTTPVIVEWEKVKDDDAKTHVDSNEGRFKFLIWDENGVPYSGSLSNAQRQTKDGDYAAPFDATVTNGVWETNGNQPSGKAWKLFIPDGYTYEARFTGSAVINNIDGYGVPADGGTDQVNWSAGNKVSGTDNDNPSTIRFETVVPTEDPNTGSSVPPVILEFLGVDNNGNFTTDAPTGAFQLRIKGPNGENLPSLYLPSAGGSYPDALNYLDRATIDANWTGQGEYTYANIWGWASNKRIDSVNSGHAYALNIPEGYSYSIEYVGQGELVSVKGQEITPDSTDDDRIVTGTVSGTGDWTSNRVVFKARWQDASAKIMKFVSGEASSDADFTFTLTADTNFNSGAWKKYDGAGNVIEESTDENKFSGKEATFTLKGDQYIIIDGIPYGTKYTVTEAPAEGYV
ncbi:MAG: hypothetical protein IJ125_04475, partial [Atopobiaceae bacterium]|nr:hypothetical protein [Atopobiaceae bacterium]